MVLNTLKRRIIIMKREKKLVVTEMINEKEIKATFSEKPLFVQLAASEKK